ITEKSTKGIGETISSVLSTLKIPKENVKSFVYASPEIQAECFSAGQDECVLRFSSALINLLTLDELKFVIGHELGHFLFRHKGISNQPDFWQMQAQEVSADRIGLICAGNLDIAFRAILKTVSGLDSSILKFNISEFISQMKGFLKVANNNSFFSTHPSMVLRSRALIWFSMDDSFKDFYDLNEQTKESLLKIDEKIKKDFLKERKIFQELETEHIFTEIQFWLLAQMVYETGSFSKTVQNEISLNYSDDATNKLKSLFLNFSKDEVKHHISSHIIRCTEKLKNISMDDVSARLDHLKAELNKKLHI